MHITFHGAAREVTGSCHVVHAGPSAVALDFGMFQGRRAETAQKNLAVPFAAADVNAVILSHAHIDHSGRLPLLARLGIDRPVYATPATRDLCAIMLVDSAHIQEKDAEYLARRRRTCRNSWGASSARRRRAAGASSFRRLRWGVRRSCCTTSIA